MGVLILPHALKQAYELNEQVEFDIHIDSHHHGKMTKYEWVNFANQFVDMCKWHSQEGRADLFAMVFHTQKQVTDIIKHEKKLHRMAGNRLTVFYLDSKYLRFAEEDAKKTNLNLHKFFTILKEDEDCVKKLGLARADFDSVATCIVYFQFNDRFTKISDFFCVPLDEQNFIKTLNQSMLTVLDILLHQSVSDRDTGTFPLMKEIKAKSGHLYPAFRFASRVLMPSTIGAIIGLVPLIEPLSRQFESLLNLGEATAKHATKEAHIDELVGLKLSEFFQQHFNDICPDSKRAASKYLFKGLSLFK